MTQIEYIDILFGDCGFTLAQRKDWLEQRTGARYTDELRPATLSKVIEWLKTQKDEQRPPRAVEED